MDRWLQGLREEHEEFGAVTARGFGERVGISTRSASGYLRGMVGDGWLKRTDNTAYGSRVGDARYQVTQKLLDATARSNG